MLAEKVELLGKGMYQTIPDVIEVSSIPTASELEYVSAEDFDSTMVKKIFPKVITGGEKMNFSELMQIDYDWICRCLRFKSYGPYFTTNRIFCPDCKDFHTGDYQVDLRTVGVKPLPKGFTNNIRISSDNFLEVDKDLVIKMITVQDYINMHQDTLFNRPDGTKDITFANICYSVKEIGADTNLTPIDVRSFIKSNFSAADYEILKAEFTSKTNYGLMVSGQTTCPVCGSQEAFYVAYQNDRFFRPAVGDIRKWQQSIRNGEWKNLLGDPHKYVRGNNG